MYALLVIRSGSPKAPGLDMERSEGPARSSPTCHLTPALSSPRASVWSTNSPNTSAIDSLMAPDWYQKKRFAVCSMTPWVSSWATTSSARANPWPKVACWPFQNALS